MCLSAEVDLVAGLVIGAAGVDALRHAEDRKEIAVAALPVLLGAHQLIEAIAWWGLEDRVPAIAGNVAVWVYLLLAFGVLPIFVPLAMVLLAATYCEEKGKGDDDDSDDDEEDSSDDDDDDDSEDDQEGSAAVGKHMQSDQATIAEHRQLSLARAGQAHALVGELSALLGKV